MAVLLSFDVDNETIWLRSGEPTVGGLSQGQYGARRGLRRVVSLLDQHGIPATFFVPSVSLRLNPDQVDLIQASGRHEFGVHGWVHEMNTRLDSATERELVERALSGMEELPVHWILDDAPLFDSLGDRSRIVALRELVEHIRGRGDVWFATHRQAAEYVRERADLGTKGSETAGR